MWRQISNPEVGTRTRKFATLPSIEHCTGSYSQCTARKIK